VAQIVTGPLGLNDMYIRGTNIFVVGRNGHFLRVSASHWDKIDQPFRSDLYSVCGSDQAIYACGVGGVVLEYRESECRRINIDCSFDLTSIWCNSDGSVFGAGGRDENGVLVDVTTKTVHVLPSRIYSLSGRSTTEIYGVDWLGVAWLWDGMRATRLPISDQLPACCLSRSGDAVIIGGENGIAAKHDRQFNLIPFALDSSFLNAHNTVISD
jgi:hypothetical protein